MIHDQQEIEYNNKQFIPSIIDTFLKNQKKDTLRKYLESKQIYRDQHEFCIDFFQSNCIQRCFHQSIIQHQSAKLLFKNLIKQRKTRYNKSLYMSVFGHFLYD